MTELGAIDSPDVSIQNFIPLPPLSNIDQSPPSNHITHRNKTFFHQVESKIIRSQTKEMQLDVDDDPTQDYFGQDAKHETVEDLQGMSSKDSKRKKDSNPYDVYFKPMVFLEFFLMHSLFFFVLGPFIVILTPIFGIHVLRNQQFIGLNAVALNQTLQFAIMISFLVVYYLKIATDLYAAEVYSLVTLTLIRVIVISVKYAYKTEFQLRRLRHKTLSDAELRNDLMAYDWYIQTDKAVNEELQTAILRLEVDSSLFFFNFLKGIDSDLKVKLQRASFKPNNPSIFIPQLENNEVSDSLQRSSRPSRATSIVGDMDSTRRKVDDASPSTERNINASPSSRKKGWSIRGNIKSPTSNSKTQRKNTVPINYESELSKAFSHFFEAKKLDCSHLYGYNLAYNLLSNSKSVHSKHANRIMLIIAIIRALLPTAYRMYLVFHKKEQIKIFTDRPYIIVILFLINTFLFYMNLFFLAISLSNLKAKVFYTKQMGHLISPKKISYFGDRKLYPTLNIFDPITLRTWCNLRKVMSEYGRKFILRGNANITICMIFYIFIACIVVLQLLGVFSIYSDPLLLMVLEFEIIVFFSIFIRIMILTAFINNQFTIHKYLLKKNKTVISDFLRMSHLYAGEDAIKPENFIYQQGLITLRQELGDENFEDKLIERSEKLLAMIDETIEELVFEEANEPATVMGLTVNYTVLKSMLVGIVSLLFAVIQSFVN